MAKKITTPTATTPASAPRTAAPAVPVASTPVRNSAVPPKGAQARKEPSYEQIAKRAYDIWRSGKGGSQEQNWFQAERELRGA